MRPQEATTEDKVTAEGLDTPDPDVSATDEAPAEGAASEPFDVPETEADDAGSGEPGDAPAGPAASGADPTDETEADLEEDAARYKKVPLRARLHAWWQGYDAVPEVDDESELDDEPEEFDPEEEFDEHLYTELDEFQWSEQRAEAAELVWGDGFIGPSGGEQILNMVKPMGLDPSMSVLDLSAGLGGGARLVAQTFGVWVTGLESSANLTELGKRQSKRAGMSKKAPIEECDLENLDLTGRSYDCIYAREIFFTVRHKVDLLQSLFDALKTDAELAFTDFVLRQPDKKSEAIKSWIEGEPVKPHPWSIEEMMEALRDLHLDVRVNEDITEAYRALVVKGLEELIDRRKRRGRVRAKFAPAMLEEAELWARRVEAFDSGDLKVYRFLARKLEMGGKGIKAMSDI